jgi:hypothetical protein
VHYRTGLVSHSQADFKAKGFDQPIYGGGDVVIKKVRSDSRHVARGIWDHVDASLERLSATNHSTERVFL